MASLTVPGKFKTTTLTTSRRYGYVHTEPKDGSVTILFLHGFPSSSYDWRHQIQYFSSKGFGILAVDLLGYGDTDKPLSVSEYKTKKIASEIIEILDLENITKVHGVAHDFGSLLLSRTANYYPDRLYTTTFLAVPYSLPGQKFDLAKVNALTKQVAGFERFGYWNFFEKEEAAAIIREHV
ncbi:hypothetical protein EIK77_010733 [Talaromyces pinophilus]|nr:hypothetical protein EIK77_010733 [Talaromyces pinophilus]